MSKRPPRGPSRQPREIPAAPHQLILWWRLWIEEIAMWNVIVRIPKSATETDIASFNMWLDGQLAGSAPQPPVGDARFTYNIPDDGTYQLTATAVDTSNLEGPPSDPLVVPLDHVNPAPPSRLVLVSATWVSG